MPPEHQSQNNIFYTKIPPIIGVGYLKVVAVANIIFCRKMLDDKSGFQHGWYFINYKYCCTSKGVFLRPGPLKKIGNFAEKSRLFQPPPLSQISKFSKRDYNKLLVQSGTFICYQNIMVYIKKISISEIFFSMIGANFADRYVIACYFLIALFMSPATIPSQSLL